MADREVSLDVTANDRASGVFARLGQVIQRAGQDAEDGYDRSVEGADRAEQRAMGFRDTLTGVQDTMKGTSMIAKGDLFNGFLTLGMGIGDLASGFANLLIPTFQKVLAVGVQGTVMWARNTAAMVANRAVSVAGAVATGVMTAAQWALNAAMTANPIGLVIVAIVALVAAVVIAYKKSETFRAIVQASMRGVLVAFQLLWAGAKALFGWISDHWGTISKIISGPIGLAARFVVQHWDEIKRGTADKVGAMIAFVRSIPQRIKDAVGDLGGLLKRAGESVLDGLLAGLRRKWDDVQGFFRNLTSKIPDWKGPAQRDRRLLVPAADMIMGGFTEQVGKHLPSVRGAFTGVTEAIPQAVTAAAGGRGAVGGGITIHVTVQALNPTPAVGRLVMEGIEQHLTRGGAVSPRLRTAVRAHS